MSYEHILKMIDNVSIKDNSLLNDYPASINSDDMIKICTQGDFNINALTKAISEATGQLVNIAHGLVYRDKAIIVAVYDHFLSLQIDKEVLDQIFRVNNSLQPNTLHFHPACDFQGHPVESSANGSPAQYQNLAINPFTTEFRY